MIRKLSVAAVLLLIACKGDDIISPDNLDVRATSTVVPAPDYFRTPTPVIEATVTVTNNTSQSVPLRFGEHCLDGLRIFKSADLSGTPVFSNDGPRVCAAYGVLASPLAPGEQRQVTLSAVIKDVLGTSLPAGTYFVDAEVGIFIPQIGARTLHVNAGAVQLTR